MAPPAYRRVPASEEVVEPRGIRTFSERLYDKLYAGKKESDLFKRPFDTKKNDLSHHQQHPTRTVAWIAVALLVARWTQFFRTLLHDERIVKSLLYLAVTCLGINTVLLLYLTVYLPRVKNITDQAAWDVYCPRIVPTMTVVGIVCGILLIRATWPVWGFLAPLLLGIESMGFLFTLHFVPSF